MAQLSSCCPSTSPQPVFGSLYGDPTSFNTPLFGAPIDFITAGPTSGMIADPTTDSITVTSDGLYEINFSLTNRVSNSAGSFIRYVIAINGAAQLIAAILFSNSTADEIWFNGSKTVLLKLNTNDQITVISNGIIGNNQYINPALIVKKII